MRSIVRYIRKSIMKHRGRACAKHLAERGAELKLDLGSGEGKKPGFIGIDLSSLAELQWDLTWGIPFDDNSVQEIRSDHFFEHLNIEQVVRLLKECYRVLALGGRLDFSVPHLDPYIDAYLNDDLDFLLEKIDDVPQDREELFQTCFDRIAWLLIRNGEHRSIFDKKSIIDKVILAGFSKVQTRSFDETCDTNYRFSSIYVVATK